VERGKNNKRKGKTVNAREIQKQIHFFLLAFLADVTAFSVCFRLVG
jgi:hypothetical protein